MTEVDLAGPMLKLDHAEVHIDLLQAESDVFLALDPPPFDVRFEYQDEPDGTRSYVGRAVIRRMPPATWGLIVSDAIQNIRQALEYLVFQMTPVGDELRQLPDLYDPEAVQERRWQPSRPRRGSSDAHQERAALPRRGSRPEPARRPSRALRPGSEPPAPDDRGGPGRQRRAGRAATTQRSRSSSSAHRR